MPDKIKILYNHVDAFAPQPTPYVGLAYTDIYYGEEWGQAESLTIQGQITGCSFSGIVAAQQAIFNAFNQSFQSLEIWQQQGAISGKVFQKDFVEIRSITFDQAAMLGAQGYSINLTCYPSGMFSGAFGVLEPADSWSYDEQPNESLSAVHTISCRPFNTSSGPSNALVNARQWAFGRTGLNSFIQPIFISGVSVNNFCLISQTENIDRFNGAYSLTETYSNDLARSGYGVIRYSSAVDSGNNLITVNLQGTAQGCGGNLTGMRYAFGLLDKTAIALKQYQDAFNMVDLNPTPIAQSFNEDPFTTRIGFSYTYNNDNSPDIFFDYSVNCSVGTNGFITAGIQGTVIARGGDIISKLARTQAYADTVSLYNLTLPFYNAFDLSSSYPLNPVPVTSGRSINQSNGTVGLNATFNNDPKVSLALDKFEAVMTFLPSVEKVDSRPILDGLGVYSAVDLGYANRAGLSINGNAVTNMAYTAVQGADAARAQCFNLFTTYGRSSNPVLEQSTITYSRTDDRVFGFTFAWSFDSPNIVGPQSVSTISV